MQRTAAMKEETKKIKQLSGQQDDYDSIALDGAELVPVTLGGSFLPVPINELGKKLLKAAADGEKDEVKKLMSQGAPFTTDWLGTSPLHIAAQNNHLEICEILLRAGISRDARTKVDRTPLHMATYEGHLQIVETLLKHRADCNCKDLLLMTPLHWAAQNGHLEVAKLLIKYGATVDVRNKFDLTPADIAAQINRKDIVDLISATGEESDVPLEHVNESSNNSNENSERDMVLSPIPVDTVLLEDDSEDSNLEEENDEFAKIAVHNEGSVNQEGTFSESFKLLEQHGIFMLQNDENSLLSSVMESGRSVVLTDVGKQMLNTAKLESESAVPQQKMERRKIITVTPEEFISMTRPANLLNHINGKVQNDVKPADKRITVKRSKLGQVAKIPVVAKQAKLEVQPTDMEVVMNELIEARKTIEEYKEKLRKKEVEVEHYKTQLSRILGTK